MEQRARVMGKKAERQFSKYINQMKENETNEKRKSN